MAFGGNDFKNLSELTHKTHVHHAVGLIQDQRLKLFHGNLVFQIQFREPSRRSHQNIDALTDGLNLAFGTHSSVNSSYPETGMFCEDHRMFCQLDNQFLSGPKNQHAGSSALSVFHLHKNRQQVRCCFSGTGLGNANDLLTSQDQGNTPLLDLGRYLKTGIRNPVEQLLI